ncbi:Small GTP-binding protein domain [Trinorchestia longiramus]|nr:Small GTP-binding protein domain [Trinorchestia longiramus]
MSKNRKNAIQVMQQNKACMNRIIRALPPPFLRQATPYTLADFHPNVKAACANQHQMLDVTLKVAKVVVLGDVGTGKTSLVNRFVHQAFSNNYKATIGVDFEVERFDVLDIPFNLQIWDTAGQERFRCIASSYYRGAHAVVLVCDVTNVSTLTHAAQWLQDAQDANPNTQQDMMVMLVVNKRDMVNDTMFGIVEVKARQMCLSLGAEYWAVSAKTGECVEDFFRRLSALVFNAAILAEVGSDIKESAIKIGDNLMCDANGNANRELKKRGCKDNNNKCG